MGKDVSNQDKIKFETGDDGVAMIYATAKGGTEVFMGNQQDFDDKIFNVSYGKNSHIDFDNAKQGSLYYWVTEGSPINYHSGSKSGRSTRIDTYPAGGMWKNDTDYYWKDNPGYLYKKNSTRNSEYTTYIAVEGDLGTHQAYAHKKGGRDEDELRSLIEMVYPTADKNKIIGHYNYAHFPYVTFTPKNYQDLDQFGADWGWLAMKTINYVVDNGEDDAYSLWEVWYDGDPIGKDGTINNNWELLAKYKDEGCDGYGNVPLTWACHKQVCRIDGFKKVKFALFSDREIDPHSMTNKDTVKEPKPLNPQTKPVVNPNHDDNSVQEFVNAMNWINNNKNTKIGDLLAKIVSQNSPNQPAK